MTRRGKITAVATGTLAVYIIGVYFILSAVLTRILPEKMSEQLNRQVSVEQIRINPLTLSVMIKGFELKEANGKDSFIRFDRLYVNAEILSVFKRGLVVKKISLEKPVINIERRKNMTFNFSDLLNGNDKETDNSEEKKTETNKPFNFEIADVSVSGGAVIYNDGPLKKKHSVSPINWKLPFISNFSKHHDRFSEPSLVFSVDGASVTVDVQTKLFKNSLETIVVLSVKGISIPNYTAYAPQELIHFTVNKGVLDVDAEISFTKEDDSSRVVTEGEVKISDLNIKDREGNDIVNLPKLKVGLLPSVITENSLHFGEILIQQPSLSAIRKPDGVINLSNLVASKDAEEEPETKTRAEEKTSEKTFRVDIDRFHLTGGTVAYDDFFIKKATKSGDGGCVTSTINDIDIMVSSFSTAPDKKAVFALNTKLNKTAPVSLNGELTITPLAVESDVALSELPLSWCQPYLPENVQLVITGGRAETSAHLSLNKKEDETLSARVTGNAAIRKFASVDPEQAQAFLGWSDFTIDGIDVSVWPLRVAVDKIAFNKLDNQLIVFEDGVSSLDKILIKKKETAKPPAKPSEPEKISDVTPVRVGQFEMKESTFSFKDKSLKPHYSTYLSLKELNVKGLTSENFKAADVSAKGAVDGYAPVHISGRINPLARDLFVDLDFKVEHMEMVPLSTYTGKYIGRAVEKGKFNVDVAYHIKEKEIKAENHLLIDQFTLGKKIESQDAMNLPVGLAISLLTDRNGMIDINLPVSGRTDDPEFAWGKVVLKALGNLIMKAATSPFSLVGSLVGGGEEMRFIEFAPGSFELDEAGMKKLDAVRKLLMERPALKLEVVGYADTVTDRQALAELALERRIKARELVKLAKNTQSADAQTIAAIRLSPEQHEEMLRKLYKKDVLEKPVEGAAVKELNDPTLTTDEMKTRLIERIVINDASLQHLAMERAGKVKKNLLLNETVSADRVFLKEPDNPFKAETNDFKPSRVELGVN